ncbi:CHAT domain-containing protein [Lentzea sp. NPDC005914]|uniref:CHAT domain-containing protein n=1 Tax=Lentzea sp. NPDC005914 TaxID=3154572 RepID=UPI0034023A87
MDHSFVIELTSAAITQFGPPDDAAWRFARCWLAAARFEHGETDMRDVELAFSDLLALPDGFPGREKLAAVVVTSAFRKQALRDTARLRTAAKLRLIADSDPAPPPAWVPVSASVRCLELQVAAMNGEPGFDLDEAYAEVRRLAAVVGEEEPQSTIVDMAKMALRHLIDERDGNLYQAPQPMPAHQDPRYTAGVELAETLRALQTAVLRSDIPTVKTLWDKLRRLAGEAPATSPMHEMIKSMKPAMDLIDGGLISAKPGEAPVVDTQLVEEITKNPALADQPGLSPAERAIRLHTLSGAKLAIGTPKAIDEAIEGMTEAVEIAGPHDPRRPVYLNALGSALIDRYVRNRQMPDLRRGLDVLEEAKAALGSHTNFYWSLVCTTLSHAYRLSGRRDLSREVALSGLRGHVWGALLQSEPEHTHAAIRSAAADALEAARMCLSDNAPEQAVSALESGRGLILYSALEQRNLDERLTAAGHPELAAHWRQATLSNPAEQPEDLRRKVLSTLAESPATKLLEPPATHEIRAALGALGMDVLVYLMPGDEKPGAAVIVPADDEVGWLTLPDLRTTRLQQFRRDLADAARATTREIEPPGAPIPSITDMCDWAWQAAIGPLLNHLRSREGAPLRMVLVPMGPLVRVPWHAARTQAGGHATYALERAVFSYAPSARLLCETAWRRRVPLTDKGFLLGDPDTAGAACALPAARAEAEVIMAAFYPEAVHAGRRVDGTPAPGGPGSRDDLVKWISDSDGGSVGHLACHAVVNATMGAQDTSYIVLAGGQRYTAEELVRTLGDAPGRDIALMVLAACSTFESGRGDDEAFTIGSAFLAANVRTAVTAQWSVPDAPSAALMFMFHHYLRAEGLPPVDALRAAQLWALSDRVPPATMPESLRGLLDRVGDLVTWAAFVHSGQ